MIGLLIIVIVGAIILSVWQYKYFNHQIKGLNDEIRFYMGKKQEIESENASLKKDMFLLIKWSMKHLPSKKAPKSEDNNE